MDKIFPVRKHPRLNNFDYSSAGAYFVTICTDKRVCILSDIVQATNESTRVNFICQLTKYGTIAKDQLLLLKSRYPFIEIDKFVIMPNHIHVVFIFQRKSDEIEARASLTDIICTYKSITTRLCKKAGLSKKMFQTSFYEHIIRNHDDYEEIVRYIENNPLNWHYDELYT